MISDDEKFEYARRVRGECELVCTFLAGFELGLRLNDELDTDALGICAASRRLNKESLDLLFAFDQMDPRHSREKGEGES